MPQPSSMQTLLAFSQLLDSSLPVGAFSHSFGFETLVQTGAIQNEKDVQDFLESALWGAWSRSDALFVGSVPMLSRERLFELETLMDASRVSRETRDGNRKIGRQALKLARAMHPTLDFTPLSGLPFVTWPLVFGWWAYSIGVSRETSAIGFLFCNCQATLSAGVRLSVLGQTKAQALLAQMALRCETAWRAVEDCDPFEFSTSLLGLEWAQVKHETLEARLFMS